MYVCMYAVRVVFVLSYGGIFGEQDFIFGREQRMGGLDGMARWSDSQKNKNMGGPGV